jgi:cellobiose-specific phosphotransferase system component IIA
MTTTNNAPSVAESLVATAHVNVVNNSGSTKAEREALREQKREELRQSHEVVKELKTALKIAKQDHKKLLSEHDEHQSLSESTPVVWFKRHGWALVGVVVGFILAIMIAKLIAGAVPAIYADGIIWELRIIVFGVLMVLGWLVGGIRDKRKLEE